VAVTTLAGIVAAIVLGAIVLLQLLLAAGLPLGHLAWGGRHRVLPPPRRIGSVVSAALLGGAAWVALAAAGVVRGAGPDASWPRIACWVLAGLLAVNTLGNLASSSRAERLVMTPLTVVLVACFVLLARG
jgi:hypothetical protein